ncbi:hypothetical protein T01_8470 [Trichinella spiralis]|uniref:Uncharacterized protein n=1 Tax=Trichinella spiralis TaxID=6334 RepID=A0A0V1C095_TRISP|nr:hypothetical protein T01_8470 [Trichinella spiralis]
MFHKTFNSSDNFSPGRSFVNVNSLLLNNASKRSCRPMQVDIKMAADQKTNNLLSHLNEMRFNSPFSIDRNSCIKRLNKPFREQHFITITITIVNQLCNCSSSAGNNY